MIRPVTLFTGQFADIPIKELAPKAAKWGYEGLELACWGDHLNVDLAAKDMNYVKTHLKMLKSYGLNVFSISNHLAGQLVCDPNDDSRSDMFAPKEYHGQPEGKRKWAIQTMLNTAKAAKNLGVEIVNGFTGSSIWHMIYSFPPVSDEIIENGFEYFAKMWNPIFDEFDKNGIKFALEVHPTEIAFDIITAKRALKAVNYRKTFGFNFDPSHLYWQMLNPAKFLQIFSDRIYHTHMKDAAITLDGESGILGSHLNFGTHGRGWDFRSLGRGDINFEEIIRTLNRINYKGPLSVEWEDAAMDREFGATEGCKFVKDLQFNASDRVFDEAFGE